ncbi:MAG: hypothetical protein GZ089_08620 [Aromatoleum sp.]|nr:hypothetical protein [Aromatoleum sp.]
MSTHAESSDAAAARRRSANLRTALILLSIALVFFFGIIASKLIGDPTASLGVIGAAVLLYLVVAIGRNLRK